MLDVGIKAPDFTLPDEEGREHSLSSYLGKKVILYFYPKDNTPGCTAQACGFSELYPDFMDENAIILGVSKDSIKSHKKFKEKYNLKFTLLSDENLDVIQKYDVLKEKTIFGKTALGIIRTTYLIDENGFILSAKSKVKAKDNPKEELDYLLSKK